MSAALRARSRRGDDGATRYADRSRAAGCLATAPARTGPPRALRSRPRPPARPPSRQARIHRAEHDGCSAANPVNQAAERIIFSFDKAQQEGHRGGGDPLRGAVREVRLGAAGAGHSRGRRLDQRPARPPAGRPPTRPTPSSAPGPAAAVAAARRRRGAGGLARSAGGNRHPAPARAPTVSVLAAGSVGPYDYEVIKVKPANSDPADGGHRLAEGQRLRRERAGAGGACGPTCATGST